MAEDYSVGKAYAFFYCKEGRNAVANELPQLKEDTLAPSELELSLTDRIDEVRGDDTLRKVVESAKGDRLNYCLSGKLPKESNEETAKHLTGMMNQMYQTHLYKQKNDFRGMVVFQKGEDYEIYDAYGLQEEIQTLPVDLPHN